MRIATHRGGLWSPRETSSRRNTVVEASVALDKRKGVWTTNKIHLKGAAKRKRKQEMVLSKGNTWPGTVERHSQVRCHVKIANKRTRASLGRVIGWDTIKYQTQRRSRATRVAVKGEANDGLLDHHKLRNTPAMGCKATLVVERWCKPPKRERETHGSSSLPRALALRSGLQGPTEEQRVVFGRS